MSASIGERRRRRRNFVREAQALAAVLPTAFIVMRLGNMQTENLTPLVVAAVAVTIAFTSLMYNRARAVTSRRAQLRSLAAAELGLRSAALMTLCALVLAIGLPLLQSFGNVPTDPRQFPTQLFPVLVAFIVSGLVTLSLWTLLVALQVVLPTALRLLRAPTVRKMIAKK
jgi:hypothetical protein